uniref:EF-hand domain-containing protein n=1 Tax=Amphiprion ocellaris TaxID=80972 RepID=A0AAQ6AQZ8_AMPOC
MTKLQPLNPGLGELVMGSRPYIAPSTTLSSAGWEQTGEERRRTWILKNRARPVTSHPDLQLTLEQVEPLIYSRLVNIQSSLRAADPHGTGLVSKEEFRRVLKSLLPVSQNQLNSILSEVCERSAATVDYMQFVRRFGRAPAARRACSSSSSSSSSSVRRDGRSTSMSLSEIQKHLKDKIGGNLRAVIRLFRLFDYKREGRIQQQEFRHILDNYCIRLTDEEFHRLWNHYSPNSMTTIYYEVFLDKLGFGDNFQIAPVCTKLEVSSRGTTQCEKVKQRMQRPESPTSSCDAPSVLPHRKLQTLFYNKMCMNSTPVWRALLAFDNIHSGLVKQDVLRAILSSFIFPMNPFSFQKLTSRYGVGATGPVRWKHFLGHFTKPFSAERDANFHSDRASELAAPDVDNLDLNKMYPHLKEILRVLTTKGCITRADLLYFLERPGGTQLRTSQPRLPRSQITELLNVLDPEHTGVIQLARLESLLPSITSHRKVNSEPLEAPAETPYIHEDKEDTAEEQKTADEKQTTQWADKASVASASWRTVEGLLLDKLCEQLSSVLAALKLYDPQHTGYITQEDLKKVLSCYGMPISDTHFKNSRLGRAGSSSTMVSYSDFLRNLGVPLTDVTNTSCCSHNNTAHTERPSTSSQSTLQSIRQQSPCSQQTGLDTSDILDVVFQRMRLRLEQRQTSLSDHIRALIHTADEDEQTLSEADVQKMLEDSWVFLDDKHFSRFTGMLGFRDGRIERSVFQAKYEEATAREQLQGSKENLLPTSAEQCLAAMRTRIQTIHGDHLTAFRLMDRKRKGVVDCRDFKALYDSLKFFCSKGEYQRLLDLIGLHPGNNLNYAEFVGVVENGGKQRIPTAGIQQQLHELLAREARSKWAAMSKVLCQFDKHGQGWIYKKSLRGLLFTYALPIRPNEFEEFWLRYDPEGWGSVKVCDFLERLGLHQDEELRSEGLKMNKSVVQQDADRPISSDATTLEHIKQVLQKNYKKLSDDLIQLGTKRDGTVTVEELLSLLHSYSCSVQREQLIDHLHRFPRDYGLRRNWKFVGLDLVSFHQC